MNTSPTQHVILICGKKGAGKDTLAEFLRPGFTRIAFADAIYHQVSEAFDISVRELRHRSIKELPVTTLAIKRCKVKEFIERCRELGLDLECARSPREILQLWGTEYAHHRFGTTYWVDLVVDTLKEFSTTDFVIPDLRYPHEAKAINEYLSSIGGTTTVFRVTREGLPKDPTSSHDSETSMDNYEFIDLVVINEPGNPDSMRSQISTWL